MSDLIKCIEEGISVETFEPFKEIAEKLNCSEENVFEEIRRLKKEKKIKRFGPVILNRSIGFTQNAMTTLKVSSEKIEKVGKKVAEFDFVTLCYEREIVASVWEYNLYFMIHGKEREAVMGNILQVLDGIAGEYLDYQILFSTYCFKQRGASYK